jgi:beta-galactosidase
MTLFKRILFVVAAVSVVFCGLVPAADPVFPYGAVYFRKSNPPEQDWERDHRTAAETGMNTFRHWFMWSAIEVAPDKFDWRDYDRMMDLAAKNGIKVVIAEMLNFAPEWAYDQYPHALYKGSDDRLAYSTTSASSETGGQPGLCLDNEDVKALAEKFLTALVERYRDHPAMMGYDVLNEGWYYGGDAQRMFCYCNATQQKFREWLKAKYGTLDALKKSWNRYSYIDWQSIHPPRDTSGFAESMDWMEFRLDDHFRLMKWRTDLIRSLDKKNLITAHGVGKTLIGLPDHGLNEWRAAPLVQVWGFTFNAADDGPEPWRHFEAADVARAGSKGKPFWHAEAQGGPDWYHSRMLKLKREEGHIAEPEDIRLWNLTSMAAGATGIMYPRWRPLLDGPLFGAYGPFGMDGSVTPRAEMTGKVAKWANANPNIWKARPVKGEIGIVFVPESEIFNYVQEKNTDFYSQAARGAYQAFFDANIQADFVHIDDIGDYPAVYLPFPLMLKEATARKLIQYVQNGGVLISEGTPGYFGDRAHVGTVQPNLGLDKLFGARERYVEFVPHLLEDLKLRVRGREIEGRYFVQQYVPTEGTAVGWYESGKVAAVENHFGKGKTLLIGTFPGGGYYLHHSPSSRVFFEEILPWAGQERWLHSDQPQVKARLHTGPGGTYLWLINPTRAQTPVRLTMASRVGNFHYGQDLWGGQPVKVAGSLIQTIVGERDAAVIRLQ